MHLSCEHVLNYCYNFFKEFCIVVTMASKVKAKNITNGEIQLHLDDQDIAAVDMTMARVPGGDIYDNLRHKDPTAQTNYYIENLRTGSFSQISQNYLIESRSAKEKESEFTTNTFQSEMYMLRNSIQTKLSKSISFFQGIFAGMALLYTITLNLSQSVARELVRVQDQSIRVIALLTTLGSLFSLMRARDKYQSIKLRGTSVQIDERYKCLVLCIIQMIFYTSSYVVYNVSHTFSIAYNISGASYSQLRALTTIFTVLCLIAWIVTNVNSKKHEI